VYWWPSDKGNGPENVQWTLLALIVAAILIPPIRHVIKREITKVHAKLDHIIEHHPDIPNYIEPEFEKFEHWALAPYRWVKKIINKRR
jgi:hypothetical protein